MNKKKYLIPSTETIEVKIESLLDTVSQEPDPNTPVGSRGNYSDWED